MSANFSDSAGLDAIDRAIIRALQANSRLSVQALSEQVGLSPTPCHRRIRKLEETGVLRGYGALVDEARIGLPVSVFVSVKLERQVDSGLTAFEAAIRACPEVVDCWLMTGPRDYLLRVAAADLTQYERFLTQTLTKIEGVASIESSFSLRRVKASFAAPA